MTTDLVWGEKNSLNVGLFLIDKDGLDDVIQDWTPIGHTYVNVRRTVF